MQSVVIIPARYGSTRFPGKPMAQISGVSLLNRVWKIAKAAKNVDEVYIATDDKRILEHVESFGAKAVMTKSECPNGSFRCMEAVENLKISPDIVINLQGDAVLTPPWIIEEVINEFKKDNNVQIASPAVRLTKDSKTGGTLVVFDLKKDALYFSRAKIPFNRDDQEHSQGLYRHIGIYGYKLNALKQYVNLKPTPLEEIEKLEQLRALENGMKIRMVIVDYKGRTHWAVDRPEDISIVEEIIKKEGELV